MTLPSGTAFAGYTIEHLLGVGALGEVYLAGHPRLPRFDVLKVLNRTGPADEALRERFRRAAAAAATLDHPHIVRVHDLGEFDGRLWVAMDYVKGIDAERLAVRFPTGMPAGEVSAIATATAAALDYAHQRAIVHGGVKPANILIAESAFGERRILLTDFGIARIFDEPTGRAAGYLAPEQLSGTDLDGRADQYALGATVFHLLTGTPPARPVEKLSSRRAELSHLDDVMATALAVDPDDRFARCRDFADALSTGSTASGAILDYPAAAAPGPGSPARRARRLRRRWMLGSVAAAALAVLAGVLILQSKAGAPDRSAADPGPGVVPSSPAAVPQAPAAGLPPPPLDGSFRVEVDRARQTFNGTLTPQPPNVTTWWAFRSACPQSGCVAAGMMLDDDDHRQAKSAGSDGLIVLDFRDGAWQSRPQTLQFACLGATGTPGRQTTTQVLALRAHGNGPLRGEMTITVHSNECGQQGGLIAIPAAAVRVGDVPPGVSVPDPQTAGR